jgi:serine/threonine-protein kinase RsbW
MDVGESLNESYPAKPETTRLVRRVVVDYAEGAGMEREELYGLRFAISEAITNAVQHAYRSEPGNLQVTARAVEGELWLLIADEGCGCQTRPETPGLGWGLAVALSVRSAGRRRLARLPMCRRAR